MGVEYQTLKYKIRLKTEWFKSRFFECIGFQMVGFIVNSYGTDRSKTKLFLMAALANVILNML